MQLQLESIIKNFPDPYLQCTWAEAKVAVSVKQQHDAWCIEAVLAYPIAQMEAELRVALEQWLAKHLTLTSYHIQLSQQIGAHAVQPGVAAIRQIKNVVAVGSGKGGVGKSTTAINLAVVLAQEGAQVGLLDADIYGPNQPTMLGVQEKAVANEQKQLIPIERFGLATMSLGYLVARDTPMMWRGPMVTSALLQLLQQTQWPALDYLFIDLPPGTGDVQLTLAQKIPVSGAIIVTTPQEVACQDARKGLEMWRKVNIPVMGVIENMSYHVCNHCGQEDALFGSGGGHALASACATELLGQLPLNKTIREQADAGTPIVLAAPDAFVTTCYRAIARRLAAKLSLQPKNYAAKMPSVKVE